MAHNHSEEREGERYARLEKERKQKLLPRVAMFAPIIAIIGITGILLFKQYTSESVATPRAAIKPLRPIDYSFLIPTTEVRAADILAEIDGVAITRNDVNVEVLATTGSIENMTRGQQRNAIQRIATRILFAKESLKKNLHQRPEFYSSTKRNYIDMLARRHLRAAVRSEFTVSLDEVKKFADDNPLLFEGRKYYVLDALDLAKLDNDRLDRDRVINSKSTGEIISYLREEQIDFVHAPFSVYSELLPLEMRRSISQFENGEKIFYMRRDGFVRIVRVMAHYDRPIIGERRLDLARERLQQQRIADNLADFEAKIYADLAAKLEAEAGLKIYLDGNDPKESEDTKNADTADQ